MTNKLAPPFFYELILDQAFHQPGKPAVIYGDRIVTYGMLRGAVIAIDSRIEKLALPANALIGLKIESTVRLLAVAIALARRGIPFVSLNHAADAADLGLGVTIHLQDSGAEVVPGVRQLIVDDLWFVPEAQTSVAQLSKPDPGNIFSIYLSSGTTGRPKPVSTTLADFTAAIGNYQYVIDGGNWDRMLCAMSARSAWGLMLAMYTLTVGKTIVCADSARECLQMIAAYAVDFLCASTRQLRELLAAQKDNGAMRCPTLKIIMTGGSLIPADLMGDAQASLCGNIIAIYGATETGCNAISRPEQTRSVPGGSGYGTPWTQIKIVGPEGEPVLRGAEGEIRIRSTTICSPYPPERAATDTSLRDGWFFPGDKGYLRPDGMLVITGRIGEVLNSGGVKLAPETIETALQRHPAILEAAAFCIHAPDGMEEFAAAVVAKGPLNEQQVVGWAAAQGIPLRRIVVVNELPLTPSGKLHRSVLQQKYS